AVGLGGGALVVAGIGHDERASTEAHSIGQAERQDPGAVDPDLATAAVAVEAILGDAGQLETHLGTYKARRDANAPPQLVERYLYVLGAFRRPELVARVLQTLDSGEVAPQAVGPILRGMLSEPHSARAAWAFLTSRWDTLKARLGEAWTGILVEGTGEVPVDLAPEVIRFWDANLGGSAQQSYARAKERLATRREFESRVVPRIAAWARELASLQVAQR
ncbi:MAG TPA: ERAP1-like C-terminal domain-containing protein, partial [Candidatus Thermoplasmatota archaeon]|nr:ERAP1-like C-terminal domain-containing protein [Candidatus Thermoplasmatota archaeon]